MNSNDLSNLMVAVVAEAKFNHTSRTLSSSPYQEVFALLKKYDEDACIGQTMKRAQESMESDIMYRTNVGYKERKTLENLICKQRIFDGYFFGDTEVQLVLSNFPMDLTDVLDLEVRTYNLLHAETKEDIVNLVSVIERAERCQIKKFGPKSLRSLKEAIIEKTGIVFP